MQLNNRKKDLIEQLAQNKKLTPDGRDWLVTALDPFHDYERPMAGFPDADGSQTIVSLYQYQTTISAPPGVDGNWDAHIFTSPVSGVAAFAVGYTSADLTNFSSMAGELATSMSLLNIYSNASGESLCAPARSHFTPAILPPAGSTDLVRGTSRIVAMGYEIHNTSAVINKQGTATSYRMPQYATPGNWLTANADATIVSESVGDRFMKPPETVTQASLLKGTRVWDAAEGVYSVCALDSTSNPLKAPASRAVVFDVSDGTLPGVSAGALQMDAATSSVVPAPAPSIRVTGPNKANHFDTSGTFLTGLNKESTFTVSLRVYLERAPGWQTPELAVLATPSPGYDVRALELYARAINALPVAVKVSENAAGDWWKAVLRAVGNAAESIGMIGGKAIPLLGKGVNFLAGSMARAAPAIDFVERTAKRLGKK